MPWETTSSREEPRPAVHPEAWSPEWLAAPDGDYPAAPRPRPRLGRKRLGPLVMAIAAFGAGISANALLFHVGHKGQSTRVVIGQQVIRPAPSPHAPAGPRTSATTVPAATMSWGPPAAVDRGYAPQSISCSEVTFCALVDNGGRAVLYENFSWANPTAIDGSNQINSVSCAPGTRFCAAVDEAGNALVYNGASWLPAEKVDKRSAPELTSVSCATPSFCVALDGAGNAVIYNGATWSQPTLVDAGPWGPASRDLATISCPSAQFCVGVDPQDDVFYFTGSSWLAPAPMSSSGATPPTEYKNEVACSAATQCVAAQNLGQVAAYNGTQWSDPVYVDPGNYVAALSCPTTTFCTAVDGLLPEGFSGGSSSGDVFVYNGISWSAARNIDGTGILQSVACPTRSFCVAVDQAGGAIVGSSPG